MGELKTMKVMLGQYPFQGHQDLLTGKGFMDQSVHLSLTKRRHRCALFFFENRKTFLTCFGSN